MIQGIGRSERASPVCKPFVFEGLFVHALGNSLKVQLEQAGYDSARPAVAYSLHTLGRCLAVASCERYPDLDHDQAYRNLGQACVRGCLQTAEGRVIGVASALNGPTSTARDLPSRIRADYGLETMLHFTAPSAARLESGPGLPWWARPYFLGVVTEAITKAGAAARSHFASTSADGSFRIDFSWGAGGP